MALASYRLLPTLQLLYSQIGQLTTMRHALDEVYDEYLAVKFEQGNENKETGSKQPHHCVGRGPSLWKKLASNIQANLRPSTSSTSAFENSSLGIVGTTGCGKSTLVDLILGLT